MGCGILCHVKKLQVPRFSRLKPRCPLSLLRRLTAVQHSQGHAWEGLGSHEAREQKYGFRCMGARIEQCRRRNNLRRFRLIVLGPQNYKIPYSMYDHLR